MKEAVMTIDDLRTAEKAAGWELAAAKAEMERRVAAFRTEVKAELRLNELQVAWSDACDRLESALSEKYVANQTKDAPFLEGASVSREVTVYDGGGWRPIGTRTERGVFEIYRNGDEWPVKQSVPNPGAYIVRLRRKDGSLGKRVVEAAGYDRGHGWKAEDGGFEEV